MGERAAGESTLAGIEACIFDAYGTLLDLSGAVAPVAARLGERAGELLALWRAKQLEYTWLRSLMGRHADFAQVVADALDYACAALGGVGAEFRPPLLQAFRRLPAYPDAADLLRTLQSAGIKTAVLSNGTPEMIEAGLGSAGLRGALDAVFSVEEVGTYKPSPAVYHLPGTAFGLAPSALGFVSANAWDAAGAASAGLRVIRVNRTGAPAERLPFGPTAEVRALGEIPALLGIPRAAAP